MSPLVIVACGARKAMTPQPASALYTGSYNRMCLRAARALSDDRDIRILSARHGLLELDTVIAPYDTRLGEMDAFTPERLRQQATETGLLDRSVAILAPKAYVALALHAWPDACTPLAGVGGIGKQRRRLAEIIACANGFR
ncbi:DUF6884 domain-containing protein [Nocardia nova]|uniref:DUF6884 domain-containing protein n=1 Tax=Nocardia nova TaxID=37330 RepID=UPI0033C8CE64